VLKCRSLYLYDESMMFIPRSMDDLIGYYFFCNELANINFINPILTWNGVSTTSKAIIFKRVRVAVCV